MNTKTEEILKELNKIIVGKEAVLEKTLMAILSRGHILLDDVPGVGKTTLALACSKVLGLDYHRIQFTPDVVPSDIIGFSMYNKESGTFEYKPGVVMTNLLLADEINRTSSKTQSALLEVMEEGQVTVDGEPHELPQAQLDRFMIRMEMGYPDFQSQVNILRDRQTENPLDKAEQVTSTDEILEMQDEVTQIYIEDKILEYVTSLAMNTREQEMIRLGVSPRGALAVTRLAKARAYVQGRDYVTPEDVQKVFLDVCAHRIILNPKAKIAALSASDVLIEVLKQTKSPDNGR